MVGGGWWVKDGGWRSGGWEGGGFRKRSPDKCRESKSAKYKIKSCARERFFRSRWFPRLPTIAEIADGKAGAESIHEQPKHAPEEIVVGGG